jgi:hypothetical protein
MIYYGKNEQTNRMNIRQTYKQNEQTHRIKERTNRLKEKTLDRQTNRQTKINYGK